MPTLTKRLSALVPLTLILCGLALIGTCAKHFGSEHTAFLAWQERREVWHQRCDAYRQTSLLVPAAQRCNDELLTLTAEAKRNGWLQ